MQNDNPYNKILGAVYHAAKERGDIRSIKANSEFMLDFTYKEALLNINLGSSEKEIESNFAKLFNTNTVEYANGVDKEGEEAEYENIPLSEISNLSYDIN